MAKRKPVEVFQTCAVDRVHPDVVVEGVDLLQVLTVITALQLVGEDIDHETLGVLRGLHADAPERHQQPQDKQKRREAPARSSP